jgi:phage tail tape-measure protein
MRRLLPSVPMILILGACATPSERTAIGAGAGAAVGAGVGALAGGWEGAALGAVVGGVAGGAIGNYLDKQAQELQQVANARRTETGILVNLKSSLLFSPWSPSRARGERGSEEIHEKRRRGGETLKSNDNDVIRIPCPQPASAQTRLAA